jgi:hypothetical protein
LILQAPRRWPGAFQARAACWGRDELALERRASRFTEIQAAARMLSLLN